MKHIFLEVLLFPEQSLFALLFHFLPRSPINLFLLPFFKIKWKSEQVIKITKIWTFFFFLAKRNPLWFCQWIRHIFFIIDFTGINTINIWNTQLFYNFLLRYEYYSLLCRYSAISSWLETVDSFQPKLWSKLLWTYLIEYSKAIVS